MSALRELVEAIRFTGKENCILSVDETKGRSEEQVRKCLPDISAYGETHKRLMCLETVTSRAGIKDWVADVTREPGFRKENRRL